MGKTLQTQECMRYMDDTRKLMDEPGLPNPTHTRQEYHPPFTRKRLIQTLPEEAQFITAAHQRR